MNNVTRGSGLFEEFLAKKRTEMANSLIPEENRNGNILRYWLWFISLFFNTYRI